MRLFKSDKKDLSEKIDKLVKNIKKKKLKALRLFNASLTIDDISTYSKQRAFYKEHVKQLINVADDKNIIGRVSFLQNAFAIDMTIIFGVLCGLCSSITILILDKVLNNMMITSIIIFIIFIILCLWIFYIRKNILTNCDFDYYQTNDWEINLLNKKLGIVGNESKHYKIKLKNQGVKVKATIDEMEIWEDKNAR